MLTVSGLLHRFDAADANARAAVHIPELSVPAGRFVVITGPSGSGKTTLLYLLSGLLRPSQGSIAWSGQDIVPMHEGQRDDWRRRHAGFVFQNFNLIEEMTAYQNVTVAAYFSAFSDRQVRGKARQLLAQLGVPDEKRRISTYSRGEQQRIALARALVFDPPILFADEPTASLDITNSKGLAEQFQVLSRAGKSVIVVSHDPVVIGAADSVIRLDHGRLVALSSEAVA